MTDYSDFLPFPAHPEKERHEPRPASIIEAAKAYKAGQPVTVTASIYKGRSAIAENWKFKAGDAIQYEHSEYTPQSFKEWLIRLKVFLRAWYYGADRIFYQFYI